MPVRYKIRFISHLKCLLCCYLLCVLTNLSMIELNPFMFSLSLRLASNVVLAEVLVSEEPASTSVTC